MTRQNLSLLQEMCKKARKVVPTEWPEGLLGIGFDMREWVREQEDASTKKTKSKTKETKTQPKPDDE
ncbi:MAG: hypothetical protein CMF52_09410 [Legionellales bacterium]|nr:hypothetical protein [Legionellales bacterium]|tara:strand:+ start:9884 stop:10084 length:201 start_codon:yes stop_codon:yes gene_type:complete